MHMALFNKKEKKAPKPAKQDLKDAIQKSATDSKQNPNATSSEANLALASIASSQASYNSFGASQTPVGGAAAPQATASQGTPNAQSGASATGRRTTKPAQPSQKEPENTGADEEKFMTAAEATLKAIQEEKKAKDFWEADKKIAAANAAVNVNRAGKETSSRISSDGQTVISSLEGLASAPYLSVRDVDDFGF